MFARSSRSLFRASALPSLTARAPAWVLPNKRLHDNIPVKSCTILTAEKTASSNFIPLPKISTSLALVPMLFSAAGSSSSQAAGAAAAAANGTAATTAAVPWYFSITASPTLAPILSAAPLGFFFLLQLSPLQSVRQIKKEKSLGGRSPLPNITLFTNCVVWTAYGFWVNDPTVFVANGMGAILSAYYTSVYAKYSPTPMTNYFLGSAGFLTAAFSLAAFLPPETGKIALGLAGNLIACAFFASPLTMMKTVIKEKSTASMPFAVSLASLGNCLAWSSYGLFVAHDMMITAPNLVGGVLALLQLSLFARFGISKPKVKAGP